MSDTPLLYQFYQELKRDVWREDYIKYLAQNVPLDSIFNEVDPLTFAIFYQHKASFHILINRGITANPKTYKDIPPILWSLEIPTNYFYLQLLKRSDVNLFHVESKFGENILANLCLKRDDIWLFKKTLRVMNQKDPQALKSLMATKTIIDNVSRYPLEICMYKLDSKLDAFNQKSLENATFHKVSTLLSFEESNSFIRPTQFFFLLPNYLNILRYGRTFLEKMFHYLNQNHNLEEFFRSNMEVINVMIHNNYHIVAKLVFEYLKMTQKEKVHFINLALNLKNFTMFEHFLKIGCQIEMVENIENLIVFSIENNHSEMYQILTREDKYKYFIWESAQNLNIPDRKSYMKIYKGQRVKMPANHRALHLACFYQAHSIINHILKQVGDSLDYKGTCSYSPRELLTKMITQQIISATFYNELITPEITTPEFEAKNKLQLRECAICLEDFHNHKVTILECGHIFHTNCLLINKQNSLECPYCRAPVIHQYETDYKLAYLVPKITEKKKYQCVEFPPRIETHKKESICLPVSSVTYEDRNNFHHIPSNLIQKVKDKALTLLQNEFLTKIEIPERKIKLKQIKMLLTHKKIGQRPKRFAKTTITEDGEWNPPNTPDYRRKKTSREIEKSLRRQNIDSQNIIIGKRTTRGVKPKLLINEC